MRDFIQSAVSFVAVPQPSSNRQSSSPFIGISRDQCAVASLVETRNGGSDGEAVCVCGHSQGAWRMAVAPAIFVRIRSPC